MWSLVKKVIIEQHAVGPAIVGLVGSRNFVTELDFVERCFRVVVGALHHLECTVAT